MQREVYLDYAATTPVDPRVAEQMARYLSVDGGFGNSASRSHGPGRAASRAVELARSQVAALINAEPHEITWTSGATESVNLAIKGTIWGTTLGSTPGSTLGSALESTLTSTLRSTWTSTRDSTAPHPHLLTVMSEHPAVLDTCRSIARDGLEITYARPQPDGRLNPQAIEGMLRPETLLISVMHVNNEIGVVQDLAAIGAIAREHGCLFHVDAAQSAGKLAIDVRALGVDLMSLSAHKIYGPKGVGALYVREGCASRLTPLIHGGGHEGGLRAGTLATHQIVGMGAAFHIARLEMGQDHAHTLRLREILLNHIMATGQAELNGAVRHAVPGIINVSFDSISGEDLMLALHGIAISSGSACASASQEPSHVLRAIGRSDEAAHRAVRISFGRFTTEEEMEYTLSALDQALHLPRSA